MQAKLSGLLGDIGVKCTLAFAGTVAAGAAIVVPSGKQVGTYALSWARRAADGKRVGEG